MFLDLIRKRRSIRRYLDKPVEEEKIDLLLEAALRAPSSRDFKPWEFIAITDRTALGRLARAKPEGSAFLERAPLAVVVLGLPAKSDMWVEDCSIASTFMQLAAEALDLGSCWIQIRERKHDNGTFAEAYVAEILGIPRGIRVESIIAVGYPAKVKEPHGRGELAFEKTHRERYGSKDSRNTT